MSRKQIDTEKICELYSSGETVKSICEQLQIDNSTVRRHLKMSGIYKPKVYKRDKPREPSQHEQKIVDNIPVILEMYESGMSYEDVAVQMNLSMTTVAKYVRQAGLSRHKTADTEEIVDLYKSGLTIVEVARQTGLCESTVTQHLKKQNVEICNHKLQIDEPSVIDSYLNCKNMEIVAEAFGCSVQTIRKVLVRNNIEIFNNPLNGKDEEIIEKYLSGVSSPKLSDEYGVSHSSIFKLLDRNGVDRRDVVGQKRGRSPRWTGHGEISGNFFSVITSRAKNTNRECDITLEYIWNLFLEQDRKCALSGVTLFFAEHDRGETTASLDRIDSNGGYTVGNVQWVHKAVNMMKQSMADAEFIDWCMVITNYNK